MMSDLRAALVTELVHDSSIFLNIGRDESSLSEVLDHVDGTILEDLYSYALDVGQCPPKVPVHAPRTIARLAVVNARHECLSDRSVCTDNTQYNSRRRGTRAVVSLEVLSMRWHQRDVRPNRGRSFQMALDPILRQIEKLPGRLLREIDGPSGLEEQRRLLAITASSPSFAFHTPSSAT